MSNNNISFKTSYLMTTIFLALTTISLIMAPSLYNNSFTKGNIPYQFPINVASAQLNGDNRSESASTAEEQTSTDEQTTTTAEEQTSTDEQTTTTAEEQTSTDEQTTIEEATPPVSAENSTSPIDNVSSNDTDQTNDDNTTSNTNLSGGPDRDCLFNPSLPKCASVDGECPDGFFQNEDEQCVPEGGCPDGYHTVDDDESGRCIPNSDGCPSGMILRPDGKTCGYKEDVCQDNPDLNGCIETPQECNNNRDDDGDGLIDSADPDCKQSPSPSNCDPSYPDRCIPSPPPFLDCKDIIYRNFQVNSSSDPHGFDKDSDGIGCETNSDSDDDDSNNRGQSSGTITSDTITVSQDTCSDAFGTINLGPGQIDSNAVRIITFFDKCELSSASILSNYAPNENLKLVVANFDEEVSDAVEVTQTPVQESNLSQVLNTVTITPNQQGYDLETGELKTINNVNGIVLWNSGDVSIEFSQGDSVDVTLDFYN